MTPRLIAILAAVTAIAVLGAAWSTLRSPDLTRTNAGGEIAFPDLHAAPESVADITLTDAAGQLRFRRIPGGGWVAGHKYDYPASGARVIGLISGLADMRLVERKTEMPERFARIGLQATTEAGATSTLLRLEGGNDTLLAATLLGEKVWRRTGTARDGVFMRRPDSHQAWLATGGVQLPPEPVAWLDRGIIDIPADRIARIDVMAENAAPYTIMRADKDTPFTLTVAGAEQPLDPESAMRLASAFSRIELDDLAPRHEVAMGPDQALALATSFDGIKVAIGFTPEGWARADIWATAEAEAKVHAEIDKMSEGFVPWLYRLADWQRAKLVPGIDALQPKAQPQPQPGQGQRRKAGGG